MITITCLILWMPGGGFNGARRVSAGVDPATAAAIAAPARATMSSGARMDDRVLLQRALGDCYGCVKRSRTIDRWTAKPPHAPGSTRGTAPGVRSTRRR